MQIKKLSQELTLASLSLGIALFQLGIVSPATFQATPTLVEAQEAQTQQTQPPASADSNRKKDISTPYLVTLSELRAFYVQADAGAMRGITIDEGVLHGTLTHQGNPVMAGDYFSVASLTSGLLYTPQAGFQGADHFKFQTEDAHNLGNISSFNFDIIGGVVVSGETEAPIHDEGNSETHEPDFGIGGGGESDSTDDQGQVEDNSTGTGNSGNPNNGDRNSEGGDQSTTPDNLPAFGGTGAGGFPENTPALVRTGGVDPSTSSGFTGFLFLAAGLVLTRLPSPR